MSKDTPLISRLVDSDFNSLPFTAAHSVLSIPPKIGFIKNIAVMPGLGEDIQVQTAIKIWESDARFSHLFVAGTNANEKLQPQLTLDRLQQEPYLLRRLEGVFTQVEAEHTRAQTDWLVEQLQSQDVESLVVCVSHWHMTRAYMTLIKSMQFAGIRIPVIPYVIATSPEQIIPEVGQSVQSLSAGEAMRIIKYSAIGQISSPEELADYLRWLWSSYLV